MITPHLPPHFKILGYKISDSSRLTFARTTTSLVGTGSIINNHHHYSGFMVILLQLATQLLQFIFQYFYFCLSAIVRKLFRQSVANSWNVKSFAILSILWHCTDVLAGFRYSSYACSSSDAGICNTDQN